MSKRMLNRYIVTETGISFGKWRRQMYVVTAIKRLAIRESVHCISIDIGHESSGSFVTMFKRISGTPRSLYSRSRKDDSER